MDVLKSMIIETCRYEIFWFYGMNTFIRYCLIKLKNEHNIF